MATPDPNDQPMQWDTVDVPFNKGVDLRTPANMVESGRLLKAQNVRFAKGRAGLARRRGHVGYTLRTGDEGGVPDPVEVPPSLATPPSGVAGGGGPAAGWVYGWGYLTGEDQQSAPSPFASFLRGAATREREDLGWDGFRLWSRSSVPGTEAGHAVVDAPMPTAVTEVLDATGYPTADIAVGDDFIVAAWPDGGDVVYSVYDKATRAPLLTNDTTALTGVVQVRCVPMGDWVHVLAASDAELKLYSFHASDPSTRRAGATTFSSCNGLFDVRVLDEDTFVVAFADTDGVVSLDYLNRDGSLDSGPVELETANEAPLGLAVAVHPVTQEVCLVWFEDPDVNDDHEVYARIYEPDGTPITAAWDVIASGFSGTTLRFPRNVTVEASLLPVTPVRGSFTLAVDNAESTPEMYVAQIAHSGTGTTNFDGTSKRFYVLLSHHAHRVGHAVHFGVLATAGGGAASDLQRQYVLVDWAFRPVARLEPGTAAGEDGFRETGLVSVFGAPSVSDYVFNSTVVFRKRVDSEDNDQFDAEGLKVLTLDYLPALRYAEYGASTYFPGGCLWQYDGESVTEAGFLMYPENVSGSPSNGSGSLTPGDKHRYKARWAYTNAQGEEVYSAAVLTDEITLGGTDDTITVTVPTNLVTAKPEGAVYLLLYRNEDVGTQWYLVTSRDPTSADYVEWDPSGDDVTFADGLASTSLIAREKDPGDAGLLEPFAPPASTVIGVGRERLWLAGGEIASGSILPSFTRFAGKAAGFSGFLTTVVGSEAVTAFAFMGHSILVFTPDNIFGFEADGPTNQGAGSFDPPRVIVADVGALDQAGVARSNPGVTFESRAGVKLLASNYQVMDIGAAVAPLSEVAEVVSSVTVPEDDEVRFYTRDSQVLVWNYGNGEWTTFTGLGAAGALPGRFGRLPSIALADGRFLVETEGVWSDDGQGFTGHVRTAWLRPEGVQGLWRARRVALLGDAYADNPRLLFRAYYNDRDFPEDDWVWAADGNLNQATWGDLTWGSGTWGDSGSDGDPAVLDRVLYVRRRLARQKCSRLSLDIRDDGQAIEGPALTVLSLEFARKTGLMRRTTTNT